MASSNTPQVPQAEPDMMGLVTRLALSWQIFGCPLRPVEEDVAFCMEAYEDWNHRGKTPRVLLLGVTPELYEAPWPEGTDILAVDFTPEMIDIVWTGPKDMVMCADWLEMDLPDKSRDIVICDGGLVMLDYPQQQKQLADVLYRILADDGICIFRLFCPAFEKEPVETVLEDLLNGRIVNLNLLIMRLWFALHDNVEDGVKPSNVWQVIEDKVADMDQLSTLSGFSVQQLEAVKLNKGSIASYHLLNPDQSAKIFCEDHGGYGLTQIKIPTYEYGKCCPTIILKKL